METRKQVMRTYVKSVLCYGSETWTINKNVKRQLEATEMWFLRRMLKVPWTAKISNEVILQQANVERSLIKDIRSRQSDFFGHITRKDQIEHTVVTGKISGRRDRGDNERKCWMAWQIGLG